MTTIAPQGAAYQIGLQAQLLAAVQEAIIATDLQGTIIYWSPFAEELYGWSAREVVGRSIVATTVFPENELQATEIMSSIRAGKSWTGEFLVKRRDGTGFVASVTLSPVLDEAGKPIGMVGISHDLSGRKRIEEALRSAHQELEERVKQRTAELKQSLAQVEEQARWLDLANDAIFVRSSDEKISYWNQGAERLYGWSKREVLGCSVHQMLQAESPIPSAGVSAGSDFHSGSAPMTEAMVSVAVSRAKAEEPVNKRCDDHIRPEFRARSQGHLRAIIFPRMRPSHSLRTACSREDAWAQRRSDQR